jgi:ABC-type transport system involved in cytochrome c biogenesis permease subunit
VTGAPDQSFGVGTVPELLIHPYASVWALPAIIAMSQSIATVTGAAVAAILWITGHT